MRTNQYAFVLVLQVVLLFVTFTLEAKLISDWRLESAASDTSQVQQVPGDPGHASLIDYLSR